ncbi:hypothetical protein ACFQ1R_11425 [Mariniflexile jejuense]|uniref:Immunity protein 35 of polymorphic toxin system n=1 Tax=Mariniflexile jejuense TaxID=1173582 RepID=A0ABW3JK06_9FLAO
MNKEEALELLKKLKPLEKRIESRKGGTIDKFFIVPIEYLTDKDYKIYWFDFWNKEMAYSVNAISSDDYTIVGIMRKAGNFIFVEKNIEYIKSLTRYQ